MFALQEINQMEREISRSRTWSGNSALSAQRPSLYLARFSELCHAILPAHLTHIIITNARASSLLSFSFYSLIYMLQTATTKCKRFMRPLTLVLTQLPNKLNTKYSSAVFNSMLLLFVRPIPLFHCPVPLFLTHGSDLTRRVHPFTQLFLLFLTHIAGAAVTSFSP
jgi:hypothetical protein